MNAVLGKGWGFSCLGREERREQDGQDRSRDLPKPSRPVSPGRTFELDSHNLLCCCLSSSDDYSGFVNKKPAV